MERLMAFNRRVARTKKRDLAREMQRRLWKSFRDHTTVTVSRLDPITPEVIQAPYALISATKPEVDAAWRRWNQFVWDFQKQGSGKVSRSERGKMRRAARRDIVQ